MRKVNDISEIRAEVLLNYLYPEAVNKWCVQNEGIFYRNYNNDLLAYDEDKMLAQTARDSFMKLLPQGLITDDSDLRGEDAAAKYKQLELKLRFLREAFKPIDTFQFRNSVFLEQQVDSLLQNKLSYILLNYFGVNIDQTENHYVREAAILLPYVSRHRGDLSFISDLLSVLFKCEVNMIKGRYSDSDSTRRWLPMVKYELIIPGLSTEEYRERTEELQPLRDFINEWMMPLEVWCRIDIKEHDAKQQANDRLTLGYNTEI